MRGLASRSSRFGVFVLLLGFALSRGSLAQEDPPMDDDAPFEELPDLAEESKPSANAPRAEPAPRPTPTAAAAPVAPPAADSGDDKLEDLLDEPAPGAGSSASTAAPPAKTPPAKAPPAESDDLEDLPIDDEALAQDSPSAEEGDPLQDAPSTETADAPPVAEDLTPSESDLPKDVRALEEKLRGTPGLPSALIDPDEPGGDLPPTEKLARVPLRPPMSDENWRKWAGPMLDKLYRIRRGDTLWEVSERFFGNPYLWPKVWHLNAQVENPNVIDPGLQLQFRPGNPNSAPELALKSLENGFEGQTEIPMMLMTKKLSFFEMLDQALRNQIRSPHPPFQYFLLQSAPRSVAEVPRPQNNERLFYDQGDSMPVKLPDGEYIVVRVQSSTGPGSNAYRVRWIGTLRSAGGQTKVERVFAEIGPGDVIVSRKFQISPLALHESSLGEAQSRQTHLVPLQEGHEQLGAEHMLMGVKFASAETGPRVGAILRVARGNRDVATALLVDRDGRAGTVWIVNGERELGADDRFR